MGPPIPPGVKEKEELVLLGTANCSLSGHRFDEMGTLIRK